MHSSRTIFLASVFLLTLTYSVTAVGRWDTIPSLWPNAMVPYKLSKSVQNFDSKNNTILHAMEEIEAASCIHFMPRTTEDDFVELSAGFDCAGPTGRQGKAQVMQLMVPFCLERKKMLRQLLHLLGLPNEHQRPDRDSSITVNWDNISPLDAPLFAKLNKTDLPLEEMPYDYNSLTHPDGFFRAKTASIPTMTPLKEGVTVGKATGLSSGDINKLRLLYC
ncbi:hypothetical protein RvY_10207 [Ramazzottius varieornatus]|uniref:Metalloendopeptidase n=1 Tax=Ramazzottius varieornatus TaxID=947166 RepID=A0A1D1VC03_RAMVA|nr:hypothetical protein RvY_10207 [Ramazzottius varieornatus]